MTIIEQRTMEIVCSNLPEIAESLKSISESLVSISAVMLGDSEMVKIVNEINKMKSE